MLISVEENLRMSITERRKVPIAIGSDARLNVPLVTGGQQTQIELLQLVLKCRKNNLGLR